MVDFEQPRVAVIGLGAQGLVAVKNLLEQGFKVTGFERNEYIGGLWHYSAEHRVSALPTTVVNVSRERACFTDFAYPPGTGAFPSSTEVNQYINDYTDNFKLWPHLRLGMNVEMIDRNDEKDVWTIAVRSVKPDSPTETHSFDKLIMAVGPHSKPKYPDLADQHLFTGGISHSIEFKNPIAFTGKRVLVVGASNTAVDTATSLVGVASKVYLSHRRGAMLLPRHLNDGTSLDHALTYRTGMIKDILENYAPRLSQRFLDGMINKISQQVFGDLDPQWNLTPMPSVIHQLPTVSDFLVPYLRSGKIESCAAPSRITGATTILLQDGQSVEADAIIFCTGYHLDLSALGRYDPTLRSDGTRDEISPRMYQNIFSLDRPESLAFVGTAIILFPAFLISDLSAMAIAQMWSNKPGSPVLPSQKEREDWYDQHLKYVAYVRALDVHRRYVKLMVRNSPWLKWVSDAAGTNVPENLGYGSVQAWKFWLQDRKFCGLLMDGVWSSHVYRLFDSDRRNAWAGAREAIESANKDMKENAKKYRKEV